MMFEQAWFWVFNLVVVVMLTVDLLVFHKKHHVIGVKEALLMSAFWIGIAFLFNGLVYYVRGQEDALNFLTGYLVEKALSIDNLFVFLLIFSYFRVPPILVHRVLFWGIFGAIVMRAVFIFFGIALVQNFHFIIYLFGVFLIFTGIKLGLEKETEIHPESNLVIRLVQRLLPVTHHYVEDHFFVRQAGKLFATPLFLVLIAIETTDLVFAVDSIPAIIGITDDFFIVYTSNILAILGLRSLYFALPHVIALFHYLHYGLSFVLVFIGVKMVMSGYVEIPIAVSLGVVLLTLLVTIFASILYPKQDQLP